MITDRGTQFGVEVAPISLSAGDSGAVDLAGGVARVAAQAARKFVMTVPKTVKPPPPRPLPFAWDESRAVAVYADSFAGAGPLAGTAPASRGTGAAAWIAPEEGWQLAPNTKSLEVTQTGAAFLPFSPEPGHVYRLSVTMHVREGGIGWAALGFANATNTRLATLGQAWMLQRHETKAQPNLAYKGPQTAGPLPRGDRRSGPQTRTVVLDTTGPRWKAFFLPATRSWVSASTTNRPKASPTWRSPFSRTPSSPSAIFPCRHSAKRGPHQCRARTSIRPPAASPSWS